MFTTRFTNTNHTGRETGTDDILSRTREKTEGFYEMIFAMINELKSMNSHDEDCEEFRTFKKEYEVDREERKGYDDVSFRKDIFSLVQQVTKLEYDLHDIQKDMKAIKHNSLQTLSKSYQRDAIVQREITNRPNILLENDMPTDPMRGQ